MARFAPIRGLLLESPLKRALSRLLPKSYFLLLVNKLADRSASLYWSVILSSCSHAYMMITHSLPSYCSFFSNTLTWASSWRTYGSAPHTRLLLLSIPLFSHGFLRISPIVLLYLPYISLCPNLGAKTTWCLQSNADVLSSGRSLLTLYVYFSI